MAHGTAKQNEASKNSIDKTPGEQKAPAEATDTQNAGKSASSERREQDSGVYLVAIGASAGGLDALQQLLANIPTRITNRVAFIVAQHVSPTHKSMLVRLLSRQTRLDVTDAAENVTPKAGYVYVTPPDREVYLKNGSIRLPKPGSRIGPKPSVDVLLESIAAGKSARQSIGIILSGTGTDGAEGFRALKRAGGFMIAQEPQTARYDGMPIAAINTDAADAVLAPEQMGEIIAEYIESPTNKRISFEEEYETEASSLEHIFKLLSKRTGTDFSNYKSATIGRRLDKCLDIAGVESLEKYLNYLRKHPGEIDTMFHTILIGVTTFFRDKEAFDELRDYLRPIIDKKSTDNKYLRIWVPGCSTGEEAYTIAIIVSELMREGRRNVQVQIFATDIDEKAINHARTGIYSVESVKPVPETLINRYFHKRENGWETTKALRSMVLFSKHDLTNNPPFLKLDLISCRNLLIYLNAGMQQQIIPLFHYALNPDGILLLGKSETVGQHNDLFSTANTKSKLYLRKRATKFSSVKLNAFKTRRQLSTSFRETAPDQPDMQTYSISDMVKETLFNTFEHPYIIVDDSYEIQEINGDVRLYVTLSQGSLQSNLFKMLNQELQIEVRSVINRAMREQVSTKSNIKRFELYGNEYYVRIMGKPLLYSEAPDELYIIIFEQLDIHEYVKRSEGLRGDEGEVSGQRIKELENELEATREHLQTYIEELETSNEELQSLNEELQSTNEELQSSNEELETSNEELQSTNEEVQIAYSELKSANNQLARKERLLREQEANMQALLSNRLQAMFLVDTGYAVLQYNEQAASLFAELRSKSLKNGSIIVDFLGSEYIETFLEEFGQAIEGTPVSGEIRTQSRQGDDGWRWFRINYTPVFSEDGAVRCVSVSLLETTELKQAMQMAQYRERLIQSVYDAASVGICVTDDEGHFVNVNRRYCEIYGFKDSDLIGRHFSVVLPEEAREAARKLHDDFIEKGTEPPAEWRVQHANGQHITAEVSARLLIQENGRRYKVTSVDNISEQRQLQKMLETTNSMARLGSWTMDVATRKITFNRVLADIFGLEDSADVSPEQMAGFFHIQSSGETFLKAVEDLISKKRSELETELAYVRHSKDGKQDWVRLICRAETEQGECVTIRGVIQDITKEKNNRNALRLYESAIKEATDAVLITEARPVEAPGPRIIFANEAFSNMTGYAPDEVIGKSPRIFQGPRTSRKELDRLRKALERFEACQVEVLNYTKSGRKYWVSFQITPIADDNGHYTHFLSIQKDITNRKLRELQKQLISDISGYFGQHAGLNNALKACVKRIAREPYAPVAEIWLLNAVGDRLRLTAKYATSEASAFYEDGGELTELALNEGLPGSVWQTQKPVFWTDIDTRADFQRRNAAAAAGLKTALGIPLQQGGTFSGMLLIAGLHWETDIIEQALTPLGGRLGNEIRRKQLEEELRHTFKYAPEMVCTIGTDGYFKKVNPAMVQQLGYSEAELMRQPVQHFIYPEDREESRQALEKMAQGQSNHRYENRFITRSGEMKWISWSSTLVQEDGIIYNMAKDITRQRELELLFDQVNKMALIGAWELHMPSMEVYWSPVVRQIFGVSEEDEISVENGLEFYVGESRERMAAILEQSIKTGASWDEELLIKTKGGELRWVRSIGQVLMSEGRAFKLFGSVQDIHTFKNTQIELREALAEKDSVLDRVGDGFFAANRDWTITYWNTAAEEILGVAQEDIVGKSLWDVFADARELDFYTYYNEAMQNQTKKQFESYYPRAQVWFDVNVYPSDSGLSVFFKDITSRKEAELELRRLNRSLERQTQDLAVSNADLEQFAFVASHDLQEPLRMITSFMARLEAKYGEQLDDKARRYIHFATDGARRMRTIILDLLEFSRVGRVETDIEQVDFNGLMQEVEKLNNKLIQDTDTTLVYENLPTMRVNRFSVRQLFQNLIQNAIKYRRPGLAPVIRIQAEQGEEDREWIFSVADNGIGMDQKYEDRIFAIFQRLHSPGDYQGNGVGLAVCKKVAEQHNGRIWVETAIGEGSTFYVALQEMIADEGEPAKGA